jgi:enolase
MVTIRSINAREILDSRGNPTIETTTVLSDGTTGMSSVPSGASRGLHEALELRDGDMSRFGGLGVLKAVSNVNQQIAPRLVGFDPVKQGKVDELLISLDGTPNKSRLGANAILSVSLSVCRAASIAVKLPLYVYINELFNSGVAGKIVRVPTPIFNIINGGKHGAGNLEFQEYQVIPSTIKSFTDGLQMGVEIYHKLRDVLASRNATYSVGDEGGFAPNLYTNADALEAVMEAIKQTHYRFGMEVFLGLDIAASNLLTEERYHIKDQPTSMSTEEFITYLINLHHDYRLLLLEDPLGEDDWSNWKKLVATIGLEVLIIGDDLIVTNPTRLQKAITEKACSAIIVKPNQIGTLSETMAVVKLAQQNDIKVVVSHRSAETNDDFIADFAVGIMADYAKFGAPARGERVAKYNRLIQIELELKQKHSP